MKSQIKLQYLYQFLIILIISTLGYSKYMLYANDLNNMIKGFCLQSFKKEYLESEKELNLELSEYTCNCFIKRINNNESIESARKKCKEDGLKKYNSIMT